ncbi:MAG: hypothetical protein GC178_02985 [Flavobacteriales bacterium]|nr:hypothetical protein [Flavobacteriales bacterium]
MNLSTKSLILGVALASALITGCKKDDPKPSDASTDLVLIASGYTDAGSMLVRLYAADSINSAFTELFIEVRDSASNEVVENAQVTILPMMDMGNLQHSAPHENPTSSTAIDGMFPCYVVFQMPGEMGWTLGVNVDNLIDGSGSVTLPLSVKNPDATRTRVVTPLNDPNAILVISYLKPTDPHVGINDFEITLHSRETMMSWPSVENYTVEIAPEMPSMGHGSPNNVNPTHTGNGHYKGHVNFTMTGLWRINLTIMDGSTVVDSTSYFEVTLL